MIGERLKRARNAAGYSLRDLADVIGVSHTAISKFEKDQLMPASPQLLNIAKALDVRTEYFLRPFPVKLEGIEYRKRSSLKKSELNKITANVYEQAERWEELLRLYPNPPVSDFSLPHEISETVTSSIEIEEISEALRKAWNLGLNPIPDLIDTLESKGLLVISSPVDSNQKFDGLAGHMGNKQIVVVSENWCGDRQRFTLVHELGHLVLKGRLSVDLDEENACNHFAGAFLLPKNAVIDALGEHRKDINVNELYMLKLEFGISMAGIINRAFQCGVISAHLRKSYFIEFSKRGWRKTEPGNPYPSEKTYLFNRLVYRALAEDYIGESKAAELSGYSLPEFRKESKLEQANAGCYQ